MPVRIKGLEDVRTATEAQIQTTAVDLLRLHGYIVLVTSQRQATGTTEGIPDLLVTHPTKFPPGLFVGLECKTEKGKLRPHQELLWAQRRTLIFREPEHALHCVMQIEEFSFSNGPFPYLLACEDRDALHRAEHRVAKLQISRKRRRV